MVLVSVVEVVVVVLVVLVLDVEVVAVVLVPAVKAVLVMPVLVLPEINHAESTALSQTCCRNNVHLPRELFDVSFSFELILLS